jgi:ketosteroid isomerase-like protein
MQNAGEILRKFYAAVIKKDIAEARRYLNKDLVFVGLFETYPNAEAYIKALTGLLSITVRLDVKKIIAEGNDVAVFFELETRAPAEAATLVAEWHQVKNGKIFHVESAFDGRPFAAMFTGGKG